MANDLVPSPHQENVLVSDTAASGDNPERMDKAYFERLGRQRPSLFPNLFSEITFVITIVMSMVMSEFFTTGFNIILPSLSRFLDIPHSARTWPAGVTNLTTAALLLPCARLASIYGGRSLFLCGHLWLMVWSVACGFSKNTIVLILCRAMQGLGAAAYLPAGLTLLGKIYRPGPRKNLVFSVYGAFACIGFYFGIFIGAVAAEFLDWRWYFWIGGILGALIISAGFFTIPQNINDTDPVARMDWLGVGTIVPGLVLVVYAFTDGGNAPDGWKTPYIPTTLGVGVAFLAAAIYVEGWVSNQPLLPPDIFRPKYMKRLVGTLFCSYGIFGIYLFYASFYIETVLHITPILTAAWFTPLAIGGAILAVGAGFILHAVPNRVLMLISGIGFLISMLLFALIPEEGSLGFLYWAFIFPAMVCNTIGADIAFNVTNVYITTAMPRQHQAAASGLINSLLYLGIAFWLGIADVVVSTYVRSQGGHEELNMREQYQIGFWTGVGLSGLSLLLVSTVRMGQASAGMTADEKLAASEENELQTS